MADKDLIFLQKNPSGSWVEMVVPTAPGEVIKISSYGTVASGAEVTASNVGSGTGVWKDKNGVDLRFKSLVQGDYTELTANGSEIRISEDRWEDVPSTAISVGTAGQIAYNASFVYVCVSNGTWGRAALATTGW